MELISRTKTLLEAVTCEAAQVALVVKTCLIMQETGETRVLSLRWKDLLEEGMATQSSILV